MSAPMLLYLIYYLLYKEHYIILYLYFFLGFSYYEKRVLYNCWYLFNFCCGYVFL